MTQVHRVQRTESNGSSRVVEIPVDSTTSTTEELAQRLTTNHRELSERVTGSSESAPTFKAAE